LILGAEEKVVVAVGTLSSSDERAPDLEWIHRGFKDTFLVDVLVNDLLDVVLRRLVVSVEFLSVLITFIIAILRAYEVLVLD